MKKNIWIVLAMLAGPLLCAPAFVQAPAFEQVNDSLWNISFEISESADVEVSVVNLSDSSVVRHLAAGVLGPNAPLPFAAGTLAQTLVWDGTDDLGHTAPAGSLSVRVRAGMGASFDNAFGDNPYLFRGDLNPGFTGYNLYGVSVDTNGMLYVFGTTNQIGGTALRQYDRGGVYQKTLFPYPGNLDLNRQAEWGANLWLDNVHGSPKISDKYCNSRPNITTSLLTYQKPGAFLLPKPGPLGEVAVMSGPQYPGLSLQLISSGSRVVDNPTALPLVASPALPTKWYISSRHFACYSADRKSLFLTGLRSTNTDTGFFTDGQIFRLDLVSGVLTSWLATGSKSIGTAGSYNANFESGLHGATVDQAGRVYVCDRANQRVAVYDSGASFLGAISVPFPEMVEVNAATGQIYVMTRLLSGGSGRVSIRKYSGFGPSDTLVWSVNNAFVVPQMYFDGQFDRATMAVDFKAGKPVIWIGYSDVKGYRDDGDSAALYADFYGQHRNAAVADQNLTCERLAVDPGTETLYFTNADRCIYKIADWGAPRIVRCSTTTNQALDGGDLSFGRDGFLYVRTSGWKGKVCRFDAGYRHAPAPLPGRSTDTVTADTLRERYGAGLGEKGFDVFIHGDSVTTAYFSMFGTNESDGPTINGKLMPYAFKIDNGDTAVINHYVPFNNIGGVQYGPDGTIYTGLMLRQGDHVYPFTMDEGYRWHTGSVIKLHPDSVSLVIDYSDRWNPATRTVANAMKVYPYGTGIFSGIGTCPCRSPRFEVDPYGRLFIPNGMTSDIAVCDNNGNLIQRVGAYGNIDGPGANPPIALALPAGVATSEDYIYITDVINGRLVRVRKTFALDNIPGLTSHPAAAVRMPAEGRFINMSAMPEPFNPISNIHLFLSRPARVRLQVFDLSGRLIRTLASAEFGAGAHVFQWDGTDVSGRKMASGLYIYRAVAGRQVLTHRTVLGK